MLRRTFVLRRQFASSASKKASSSKGSSNAGREAVFIDGCRTPFQMSGTGYKDLLGWQLGRLALHGLAERNPALDLKSVDRVIYGNVIQEVLTANVGRESALAAGFPQSVPANTVTMVCERVFFCLVSVVLSNFFGFYVTFFFFFLFENSNCTRACFQRCFSL